MHISDFDFELPEELIAQHPLERRDASRMLVVSRPEGAWRDATFADFPSRLREGDVVVVNNTRVFPARLVGRREPTGGRVELLLVRRREEFEGEAWEVLAKPARRLEAGARVTFGDGRLSAEAVGATRDGAGRVVRFHADGDFDALLEEFGQMPLPPYIKREA
ncbi:MAG TPA: S-adenosylmethionine:tRNA ribosyltransferase-isomerase, partial [Pyrinomonadaceae bacterium]